MDILRHLWWWFEVHTGTVNEGGPYYGFFSGFGSDLGEVAIIGAVIGLVHHHNCHVKGCWRPGLHHVEGTPYVTCKTHHPAIDHTQKVTADTVAAAHSEAQS